MGVDGGRLAAVYADANGCRGGPQEDFRSTSELRHVVECSNDGAEIGNGLGSRGAVVEQIEHAPETEPAN